MADKYKCERCGKGFPTKQHYGSHIGAFKRFGTGCEPEEPRAQRKRKNSSYVLPGVKEAREANGWSRMDLAKRAEVSENTVARIERGIPAWPRSLKPIADILGLPFGKTKKPAKKPTKPTKPTKTTKLPVPIEVVKGGGPDDILEIPVRIKIYVSVERS